ncbi:MAG: ATP-binding protein [Bacteroidales bacterium]|nr:ATP-binding protein [Bacteroidales bacterium]
MADLLVLHNDVQEIPQLADFIDSFATQHSIPPALSMSLNLALEEAVVNVMNYAYPAGTVGEVHLSAEAADGTATFVLTDSGTPFDPTATPPPDLTLGADDRPIGGLGIFLVGQIMDTVAYQRQDDKNILTMTKNIKQI